MTANHHEVPVRLNRSQLAVPGSSKRFLEKARLSSADIVMLDLEDSVAPDDKQAARSNIIEALTSDDWSKKTVSCRINAADTHFMYRDLIELVEQAGEHIDLLMIPKVEDASTVQMIDTLLTQIETAKSLPKRIGIEIQIESALGMQNIHKIASASARNESLHFGPGDYAASIHARTTDIGGQNPDYPGDMWHYALSRIVVAARANGLRPVDGPNANYSKPEDFKASAKRAVALGFEGKWVIHPSQIDLANEIMGPNEKQVAKAREILLAMDNAKERGSGAATLDGKMIDYASVRQAEMLVKKAEMAK